MFDDKYIILIYYMNIYLANISKQGADLCLRDSNDPFKIYIIIHRTLPYLVVAPASI